MTSRTVTTAAIVLSLAAAGAPTAIASDKSMLPTSATAGGDFLAPAAPSMLPSSAAGGGDFLAPAAPPSVVRAQIARAQAPKSAFDWGDAGIGAAGLALSVVGVGGAFAASRRRNRRATALTS